MAKLNPPHFPDVSAEEYEKILLAKFRAKDPTESWKPLWHLSMLISIGAIGGLAVAILVWVNWKHILRGIYWIDDLGWVPNLLIIIFGIAVTVSIIVVRSANRSRAK